MGNRLTKAQQRANSKLFWFCVFYAVLTIVAIPALIYYWRKLENRFSGLAHINSLDAFELTSDEKQGLDHCLEQYAYLTKKRDAIYDAGRDIPLRVDNTYFHARTQKAKTLNKEIEYIENEMPAIVEEIEYLEALPQQSKNDWLSLASWTYALRYAVMAFAAASVFFLVIYLPDWLATFASVITFFLSIVLELLFDLSMRDGSATLFGHVIVSLNSGLLVGCLVGGYIKLTNCSTLVESLSATASTEEPIAQEAYSPGLVASGLVPKRFALKLAGLYGIASTADSERTKESYDYIYTIATNKMKLEGSELDEFIAFFEITNFTPKVLDAYLETLQISKISNKNKAFLLSTTYKLCCVNGKASPKQIELIKSLKETFNRETENA